METSPRQVDVSGLRIAYRRAGEGEPVLLIHGGFSDSREWRGQLDGLSDEFDVIAVDCPGCGGSADPPKGFTLRDYADTLAGFLAALGVDHPHVGGLSFGSIYALVFYRFHPQIPRSLILAGAYAGWAGSLPPSEVRRRMEWVTDILDRPVDDWGPDFLATVYGDDVPPGVLEEAMEILRDVRPEGFRPVTKAFFDADLRDVLPQITVPTLLLYGERDERSPRNVAEDLHRQIRGSELVVVPGVGHGINAEAPDEFNAAVRDFISA
ncbi:MAG: alpha/beta hydrolase [Geodermatophilaceae bacterium]|nr:alpha/beta hydrolase [Geodermatophilaceae bacterium]